MIFFWNRILLFHTPFIRWTPELFLKAFKDVGIKIPFVVPVENFFPNFTWHPRFWKLDKAFPSLMLWPFFLAQNSVQRLSLNLKSPASPHYYPASSNKVEQSKWKIIIRNDVAKLFQLNLIKHEMAKEKCRFFLLQFPWRRWKYDGNFSLERNIFVTSFLTYLYEWNRNEKKVFSVAELSTSSFSKLTLYYEFC